MPALWHPSSGCIILHVIATQRKTWVSTFCSSADWGLPQPLLADEQSDTHVTLLIHPKVCYEGIVCLQAHNGNTYSAYPWHQTLQCLWQATECGNFNQPIDKASCDAFPLCSVQPHSSTHLNGHHRQWAIDRGKDTKKLVLCVCFC